MTCGPGSPGTPRRPWWPRSRHCGPAPATPRATPPASRCASWGGARCSSTASSSAPGELIVPLVTARAPGLLALYGIGPNTAALLLIAAGDHPGRLRSEAAWAHLCAAAPIPASSGKVTRHRHGPGGDRQDCHALWRIVFTRMGSDPATRTYVERRTKEGKSKAEIIRCLKRYVAREIYPHLRPAA
jgi:transposase